jgi:hypothetical protein
LLVGHGQSRWKPTVTGIGGLWVDGAFWFETGETTRKGRNLARDQRCTLSVATAEFDHPLARCTSGRVDEYSGQRHKGGAVAKATTVVNGLPESGPSARRRHPHLYGTLVALVGFLLLALPAAVSAFFAVICFTGCPDSGPVSSEQGIFGCHEPERLKGTLAALVALVLLALPVIAGVLTARAVSRRPGSARTLKFLALVVLLGMAVLCIISVIMIHGPF